MKNVVKLLIIGTAVIFLQSCAGTQNVSASSYAQVQPPITYQTFYDDLSPYGSWIEYPGYGHVWSPRMAGEFRPYLTNGYWSYSNEGWLWQSEYSWGWAPFHYGRWIYDDSYGWLWIPGYEWAPAWVTWGMFDNNYAWAPLTPEVNVGIQFGVWRPAPVYWNVCPRANIYDRDMYVKVVHRENITVNNINKITIINNYNNTRYHNQYYSRGPQVGDVEKYTNRKIEPVPVREVKSPQAMVKGTNEKGVYRPQVIHPQPREFRRIDNAGSAPVRNNEDRVNTERARQSENINRLPVTKAPAGSFPHNMGGGHQGGGNGRPARKGQR